MAHLAHQRTDDYTCKNDSNMCEPLTITHTHYREACDTHQSGDLTSGEYANEGISARCNPSICKNGISSVFYTNHPTNQQMQCSSKDGDVVTHRRNIPLKYKTNLCMQAPVVPSKCSVPHGMLMGLQGVETRSLYASQVLRHRTDQIARFGAGLFVHGGNPLYYTSKGTSDDVAGQLHSVLRGHLDDLGGHHLVLKIFKESWTGEKLMRVERVPLTAAVILPKDSAKDPANHLYTESMKSGRTPFQGGSGGQASTTWGSLADGWLYNLAGTMRLEQTLNRVDVLYPEAAKAASSPYAGTRNRWSCPLRRLSFWSRVTRGFSPLVPSPARAARLFGGEAKNMIHGTRSHPTQMFGSLYDKLANILTPNGFCFCVDWQDCQVASSDMSSNRDCTLLETIRSMYDAKFRTTRLLTQNDQVCTQQLDWPFTGGLMRDMTESVPRYTQGQNPTEAATQTCNVLDRLPPFQYRWGFCLFISIFETLPSRPW